MIRVIICDDQEIVREGLQMILDADPKIEVVGSACDGRDLVEKMANLEADVVLMDLKMPLMNGIEASRWVRQNRPFCKVLILTTYDDDEWLFDALQNGAAGYLLKDTPAEELRAAVRGTAAGESFLDPAIAGKVIRNVSGYGSVKKPSLRIELTQREQEILTMMAQGLSNADIARNLYLSEGTVRNYTSSIFSKLGVSDRTKAVIAAIRDGLVDLDRM